MLITITCTIGKTKARVFPLPVGADTQMSLGLKPALPIRKPIFKDSNIIGITCIWTKIKLTQEKKIKLEIKYKRRLVTIKANLETLKYKLGYNETKK